MVLDKTVTDMVGFFCKEVRPGSRRDFCFWGRNIPNSEEVNPRSEFPKRTFKEERSMLRHYKDLPRQTSSTKTKSRFLAPLGMTGRRLFQ